MAGRIPQYEAQVSAQADRRVISTPVLNQDVGEGDALRAIGGAIDAGVELAVKLEKANQDRQITTADRVAREKLDRLKFDLENTSPDVADEDLKKRYQEQSEAAIQEAGKTIANPRARDIFTERARGYQSEGALWTDRLGLKRGVDRTRAGHVTAITEIDAKAGDVAIKRETFLEDVAGEKAAVERARQLGVYTQEQFAELNAKLDGIAIKDNTMRFGANMDALVKDGRIAEARAAYQAQMGLNASEKLVDRVDPDVLAKINAGLETAGVQIEAVQASDRLWAEAKGNLAKYNELVAGEKNVPKRLRMEQRGGTLDSQTKAAKEQEQDAAAKELFDWTRAGNDPMRAPPSLLGRFDNASRMASSISLYNSMQNDKGMTEAQKVEAAINSAVAKLGFESLARTQPSVFMQGLDAWSQEYRDAYNSMTWQDKVALTDKANTMKESGFTSDAVDKVLQDVTKEATRFAPSIMNVPANDQGAQERKFRFEGLLYGEAKKLSADQGGQPISPDQARKIVLRALGEFDKKKYGEGVNMALGFDADVYRRVRDTLAAKLGAEPSRQAVYEAYQSVMAN